MPSRHLVDPELLQLLETFPASEFSAATVASIRERIAAEVASTELPRHLPVDVEERRIPGPAGAPPVRVVIYRARNNPKPSPALLHVHGGGYTIGVPEMMAVQHYALVDRLGCTIVSVDYRLAPETTHPGPVEDCYAALKWLYGAAPELGVDPARIAVGGESAGGGLAAALALLARDRGEIPVIFQHLIAPMLDDRTAVHRDAHSFAGEFIWTREHNLFGWSCLLGRTPGDADVSHYASAARAVDLEGLPPAFISVGALDLFVEEDIEYARRLTRAGVSVELHVYPGAFHCFELATQTQVAVAAERASLEALRKAFRI